MHVKPFFHVSTLTHSFAVYLNSFKAFLLWAKVFCLQSSFRFNTLCGTMVKETQRRRHRRRF